jgi:hypothetical protein
MPTPYVDSGRWYASSLEDLAGIMQESGASRDRNFGRLHNDSRITEVMRHKLCMKTLIGSGAQLPPQDTLAVDDMLLK